MTRRCLCFVLVLMLCGLPRARADEKAWGSGDGRFTLKKMNEDNDFALVEVGSGKSVMGTEELVHSANGSIATVWAKDSTHVAVNYRSGGKYEAMELYAWKGEQFEAMKNPTDALGTRVNAERAAQVKRLKLPAKTSLRSLFETYRTLRWLDGQTVEVYVRSEEEYVRDRKAEDTESIVIAAVYTVRFDPKGKPQIVGRRPPTAREAEG